MYIIADMQEIRLYYAVLQRAIEDALCPPRLEIPTRYKQQAIEWINDNSDGEFASEPFTFNWICEVLNLDSNVLRHEVSLYIDGIKSYKGVSSRSTERMYRKINNLDDPSGLHYRETSISFRIRGAE